MYTQADYAARTRMRHASYPVGRPATTSRAAKTAICSGGTPPPLNASLPNMPNPSVCRVYLTIGACTGFFVGENYVATARHCVSTPGSGAYLPDDGAGTFGRVCCRTRYDTYGYNCDPEYSFDVIGVVTTCGWLKLTQNSNDGAVLLVRPVLTDVPAGTTATGVPLPFSQVFKPAAGVLCPAEVQSAIYAGYPGSFQARFEGCYQAFEERLFYAHNAMAFNCSTEVDFGLYYSGSGCPGMSGGPLFSSSVGSVFGIISVGSDDCKTDRFPVLVGAAPITNSSTTWGACVSCLVDALEFAATLPPPPAGGSTPPSPSFSLGDLLGKKHLPSLDDLLP